MTSTSDQLDRVLSMAALGLGSGLADLAASDTDSEDAAEDGAEDDVEVGEDDDANQKDVGEVYADRNLLALAFARSFADQYGIERVGYYEHDEWAVVAVDLAPDLPVSWHVRPEVVPDWLPERDPEEFFDGHTRAEKNTRLAAYVYDQPTDAAVWGWWK